MTSPQSPFDAIKQVREDGTEFWSARDLMKVMGYTKWQRFQNVISRTSSLLDSNNIDVGEHLSPSQTEVHAGNLPVQVRYDFDMSLFFLASLVMFSGGDNTHGVVMSRIALAHMVSGYTPRTSNALLGADTCHVRGALYVLECSDGTVKVGRSAHTESRIRTHRYRFRSEDVEILREFVTDEINDVRAAETELICVCLNKGRVVKGTAERFTGVTFAQAVSCARRISEAYAVAETSRAKGA